jgi:predicted nucleotidyltransferase
LEWIGKLNSKNIIRTLKIKKKTSLIPEKVTAIYIYGSSLTGRLREESDIDVAILPAHGSTGEEILILISKIESIVGQLLNKAGVSREVSVADLRGKFIPLTFQYKIVTEGMLIYERDMIERAEFENAVKREYFDFVPYLQFIREKKYGHLRSKA